MTFNGTTKNGVIVFPQPVAIPNGAEVRVDIVGKADDEPATHLDLLEFAGLVDDWPEDMAENHDHYIHGAPKR